MTHILETMSNPEWRQYMGRRFEALTDEVFHIVRWAMIVGFVRYLETTYQAPAFTIARWVLSFFLFGYIASRFLLRPEIQLFPGTASRFLIAVRIIINFAICFITFALVLWSVSVLADVAGGIRGQVGAPTMRQ